MEIQGKIINILDPKGGESTRGSWKKQEFILETNDSFPKKVCIVNWNDKVDISSLKPGDDVVASVNIESREYNNNWYTDVKVWKIEINNPSQSQSSADNSLPGLSSSDAPPPPWESEPADKDEDDMPF
jgi:hypothetical protein